MLRSIDDWVKEWYLEEVEEKPEYPAWAIWKLDDGTYIFPTPDPSILEKLREELGRRMKRYDALRLFNHKEEDEEILSFLTSLEQSQTKEEPQFTPWQKEPQTLWIDYGEKWGDKSMEVKGYKNPDGTLTITSCEEVWTPTPWQEEPEVKIRDVWDWFVAFDRNKKDTWTPTPWQEIEVSNDGLVWEERKYCCPHKTKVFDGHCTYGLWEEPEYWLYARPIDNIEPELPVVPDFERRSTQRFPQPYRVETQLEFLTKAVQFLLSKQK